MQQNEFNRQFRNHFFDYTNMHKSSRFQKDDISVGLAPLRNVEGVRAFHRTNESKILPHIREGMKEREDCEVNLRNVYPVRFSLVAFKIPQLLTYHRLLLGSITTKNQESSSSSSINGSSLTIITRRIKLNVLLNILLKQKLYMYRFSK